MSEENVTYSFSIKGNVENRMLLAKGLVNSGFEEFSSMNFVRRFLDGFDWIYTKKKEVCEMLATSFPKNLVLEGTRVDVSAYYENLFKEEKERSDKAWAWYNNLGEEEKKHVDCLRGEMVPKAFG